MARMGSYYKSCCGSGALGDQVVHGGLWGHKVKGFKLSVCMDSGALAFVCILFLFLGVLFSAGFLGYLGFPHIWLVRGQPFQNRLS